MIRATVGAAFPIQVLAVDGRTDLFARATLYANGSVLTILTLTHIGQGMYGTVHTSNGEGFISIVYQFYTDSGFTIDAGYDLGLEGAEVSSDKTNMVRILGLLHENTVFDQQAYNGNGNLLTGRLRAYDSKAHAQAAGGTGLLFTYAIAAAYTDGDLTNYVITRES